MAQKVAPARGVPVLLDMLTYKRPTFSVSEEAFIEKFLAPLNPHRDDYGNLWVEVGDNPEILWSSHTDTVHHDAGRQAIKVCDDGMVRLDHGDRRKKGRPKSNCLGADCAAGVWLMREMILAGAPGLYIFHRDEECGGRGSGWIAKNAAHWLTGVRYAVAFDRKGCDSVITHQGGRTASDAFARSLAAILGGTFRPDDTGLFTDTAMYSDLLPECSNVSVGYRHAHGPREELDLAFLTDLLATLLAADWSGLVCSREPGECDDRWWGGDPSFDRVTDADAHWRPGDQMRWFVEDNPAGVADFLRSMGFTQGDLEAYLDYRH